MGKGSDHTLFKGLETACLLLADNPRLGRASGDVSPGFRRMEVGKHAIFYRVPDEEGVLVVRILHRLMLPGSQEFEQ